jgi:hypothetical protein
MGRPRHDFPLLEALWILGLGLIVAAGIGCGSSNASSRGSSESNSESTRTAGANPASEAGNARSGSRQKQPPAHHFRGGEKDIEEFGSEATGSESEAVVAVEQGYLSAIVKGDYRSACSLLFSALRKQILALTREATGAITCPRVLPHILVGDAARVAAQQLSGTIVKVRVEGDRGFVVFHAPGARLFVFPLAREDGSWRVTAITSSILAPSAATLGE